ncbi:unnamed protein product [Tetraodon nigroviridis]|uniref:(spotted green pufferfish) hypothetical protein n=1 Tax=Tetraodon nigroviridis TaxID=99883 RepID=Q4RV02_TETNG|nr:unnamed protein product [Tetraodon nigroviridis]
MSQGEPLPRPFLHHIASGSWTEGSQWQPCWRLCLHKVLSSTQHPLSPWLQRCICYATRPVAAAHASRHWSARLAVGCSVQWERKLVMS